MQILYSYLRNYWKLLLLSLLLATINQVFSLLDPLIFRHIIDDYATKFDQYTFPQFLRGVGLLLGMAVGVAFVSRVAKNFQDFYVNTITQRLGAKMYADGIQHSLELPYQQFEDERSGETLGKIQKARTDAQELISSVINVIFVTLVGFVFVMIYAVKVYWPIAPLYFLTIPIIGGVSIILSRKIKRVQQIIFAETASLAGATTESLRNIELVKSLGLSEQEIKRLNNLKGIMIRQQEQLIELTPHNTQGLKRSEVNNSEVAMLQDYLLHIMQFGSPEERIKILCGIKSKFRLTNRKLELF